VSIAFDFSFLFLLSETLSHTTCFCFSAFLISDSLKLDESALDIWCGFLDSVSFQIVDEIKRGKWISSSFSAFYSFWRFLWALRPPKTAQSSAAVEKSTNQSAEATAKPIPTLASSSANKDPPKAWKWHTLASAETSQLY
jgi:hypothetical protein